MNLELEKAQVMFKLARKNNWGHRYDRTEHFKRFQNLNDIIKELSKEGWLLLYKKPNYLGISLNTQHKKEIVELIEKNMPHIKGIIG
ncbi:MAG TPA: hypothetical protein VJK51_02575 [Candidatus Nanoarchaeia archaeon]|nr:hypothetical protein [Candidatus Nanoarchaeia archaeon]